MAEDVPEEAVRSAAKPDEPICSAITREWCASAKALVEAGSEKGRALTELIGNLGWRKGSRSNGNGGNNCVEVADLPDGGTAVRDSKNPTGPTLEFTRGEWTAFLESAKAGEFDSVA